jgi:hypothetical protein
MDIPALVARDEVLRAALGAHGSVIGKTTGDGVWVAVAPALKAIVAAVDARVALCTEGWDATRRGRFV